MIKLKDRFKNLKEANLPNSRATAEKYGHDTLVKLYYNENKYAPSPKVIDSLEFKSPNIYPEYKEPNSMRVLSERFDLPEDYFYFSNGSDAILDAIPTLFASKTANNNIVLPSLTFGRIETTAIVNDIKVKKVDLVDGLIDLDKMYEAIDENTSIVYIVNPNMPTGKLNPYEKITEFMDKVRDDVLVVIDEAYGEYAFGIDECYKMDKQLIDKYDNLIITHTLSKLYALGSFRVGYMLSRPYITNLFRKAYQYLPVNKYSLQAASIALQDQAYYDNIINIINSEKERYYAVLDKVGLKYYKSYGNFIYILVDNNKEFEEYLVSKYGFLIRSVKEDALRITVGTEEENNIVLKALEEFYG